MRGVRLHPRRGFWIQRSISGNAQSTNAPVLSGQYKYPAPSYFSCPGQCNSPTTSRVFSSNTGSDHHQQQEFVDPALIYGRTHSHEAQECLKIPPLPALEVNSDNNDRRKEYHLLLQSMEEYWEWRQWNFPVSNDQHLPQAKSLVSHVLSAPLTLAKFYDETFDTSINTHQGIPASLNFHWCCIGARAEATLPMEFWMELLVTITHLHHHHHHHHHHSSSEQHGNYIANNEDNHHNLYLELTLDFVGPDIHPQIPPKTLTYRDSKLHLNWLHKGLLHDYVKPGVNDSSWSAFVLLNPGLAHPHLVDGWKPTLKYLLDQTKKPILWTAHSRLDSVRDWNLLQSELQTSQLPPFRRNPFASHIMYEDPFDKTHMVQPNHSYLIIEQ